MQQWLIQFGTHHQYLIYFLTVLVAIVEGPILSMIFGVLLHLGYFSLIPAYIALMLGDILGDTAWYYLGYHYGRSAIRKFGKRFNITEEGVEKAEKLFHRHKTKILFISKITNGIGFSVVVLVTAGIARIPFRKYLAVNIAGQMIWSGLLLAVGYFFSSSYQHINSVAGKIVLVLVLLGALYGLYRYVVSVRAKIIK
jgi:membrane-associated protein